MLKDVVYSVDVQAIEKEDRRRWSNAMAVLKKKTVAVDSIFKTDLIPIWDSTCSTDSEIHRDAHHGRLGQRFYPLCHCRRRAM